MKFLKSALPKAVGTVLIFTLLCGLIYTLFLTAIGQAFFRSSSNGSIIEVNGVKYGSELLGQKFSDPGHMWGRVMNLDVTTFQDKEGNALMYATPSNLSPASKKYESLVAERVRNLRQADPSLKNVPVPVDLVTCSGSGLDPDISLAAADYQVHRIATVRGKSEEEVREIISRCTEKPFLGIFGEPVVNVLKVNLILDGVLQ